MSTASSKKQTIVRIDRDLYRELEEMAKRSTRSVNQQIIFFIRQGLEREDVSPTAH